LDFSRPDRRDFAPIGYQCTNKNTGKPVEWNHVFDRRHVFVP